MIEIKSKRKERSKVFDLGNGKRRLICHCKPIHYKPIGKTNLEDINLDFQDDKKGNYIADKNKVSVGFRKDKKLEKYFGLRYDYEHQFEGTIKEIKLDNVEKVKSDKVSSLQRKSATEIKHKLNSEIEIVNRINEVSMKNFVKVNNPIEDFRIVEELHLKGLTCSNRKKGNSFIPDEHNRFNFVDEKGKLNFWINQPFFEDNAGNSYQGIVHTLQEIKGHLIYTKTPTKEGQDDLVLAQYPILIDTSTYYSSTADGNINNGDGSSSWDTEHDLTTGSYVYNGNSYDSYSMSARYLSKGPLYYLTRSFFYFDTSGIGSGKTVTSAVLKLYGYDNSGSVVSAQKGTQADTLTTADYDSFSGSEYGHVTWGTGAYKSITFNSTGKSDVQMEGTTKICCREYTYDYLDTAPSAEYMNGCYYADETGTSKDPKLEIDYTSGGSTFTPKAIWF